jgi:hypothetical protein
MTIIVVRLKYEKHTDELAFSSIGHLTSGLIHYIKNDDTPISHAMKEYFEAWQKENQEPWEWQFQDNAKYWAINSFTHLLKPFNCEISSLIVDQGLC